MSYFFIVGHHHYARYLSWHCLEMSVLPDDLMAGAFVCRHKAGRWNSVLSDQFGKCSHPLKTDNDDLYNIFNGQVALTKVNVADSLSFGEPMVAASLNALPSRLYSKAHIPCEYHGTSKERREDWRQGGL